MKIIFLVFTYNAFFLLALYNSFDCKYEAEVLRYKNAELIKASLTKELDRPAHLLTDVTILKAIGVCIVLGVTAYGFYYVSSVIGGNCVVKAYTMGNAYLVGVLDGWTGVPFVSEVTSNIPQEVLLTELQQQAIATALSEELQGLSGLMAHLTTF